MSAVLDMALDDIIKTSKQASGPARRLSSRDANRAAPYYAAAATKAREMTWQQDSFAPYIETGTKLYITNLDFGVSNDDIKELFSEVGDLKRYGVHYDRSGRSKGTAEVVFSRQADAIAAVKRYSNVQLDRKPMKAEIVRTNISTSGVASAASGATGNSNGFPEVDKEEVGHLEGQAVVGKAFKGVEDVEEAVGEVVPKIYLR